MILYRQPCSSHSRIIIWGQMKTVWLLCRWRMHWNWLTSITVRWWEMLQGRMMLPMSCFVPIRILTTQFLLRCAGLSLLLSLLCLNGWRWCVSSWVLSMAQEAWKRNLITIIMFISTFWMLLDKTCVCSKRRATWNRRSMCSIFSCGCLVWRLWCWFGCCMSITSGAVRSIGRKWGSWARW